MTNFGGSEGKDGEPSSIYKRTVDTQVALGIQMYSRYLYMRWMMMLHIQMLNNIYAATFVVSEL